MQGYTQGEDLRWGIIGCGDVTEKKSGPALYETPGSQLVAVMRRDAAKAQDYARRHGARRWYGTVDALLGDPDVNAIYVSSPHDCHLEHVTRAVAAGHRVILCEKPMGTGAAQAQAIVDVCQQHGASLTVAYYRRYWPVVESLRGILAENGLGEIIGARVLLLDGFFGDPARPWLTSRSGAGGGALANAGSHWIDLLRFLLGEVSQVAASTVTGEFEVEDTAIAQLMIGGRGRRAAANFYSSWKSQVSANELEILGSEGRVQAAPLSEGRLVLQRTDHGAEERVYARPGAAHAGLIAALVRNTRAGLPSPVPGEEAVAAWRVIEAAYESSATGRLVTLPD